MTIKRPIVDVDQIVDDITHDYDKQALYLIPNIREVPNAKGPNEGETPKFITNGGLPIACDLTWAETMCARYGGEPFPLPLDWVEGEDYVRFPIREEK